jgi:hypothetical protein
MKFVVAEYRNQFISMCISAIIGIVLAMTIGPGSNRSTFVSAVFAGWVGVGVYAFVCGDVTIGGKGGKSPKTFQGTGARLIGLIIMGIFGWLLYKELYGW